MKRITIKPQFVEMVKSGEKRVTARPKNLNLKVGDEVGFVARTSRVPAFLVKAKDGFAFWVIEKCVGMPRDEFGQMILSQHRDFGFGTIEEAHSFYGSSLIHCDRVWIYHWRLK